MNFHRMQDIKMMWFKLDNNTPAQSYIHEYTDTKYTLENAGKFIITTFAF